MDTIKTSILTEPKAMPPIRIKLFPLDLGVSEIWLACVLDPEDDEGVLEALTCDTFATEFGVGVVIVVFSFPQLNLHNSSSIPIIEKTVEIKM